MALIGAILVEIKIIEFLCERSLREGDRQALQPSIGVPYALIWNGSQRYCTTLNLRKTSNRSFTKY